MIIQHYITQNYKMTIKKPALTLLIILGLLGTSINSSAADIEYEQTNEVSPHKFMKDNQVWKVKAYQAQNSMSCDDETVPARICFIKGSFKECFEAKATVDDNPYDFQSVKELSIVELFKNKLPLDLVVFVSEYCSGCAESLRLISFWAYLTEIDKFDKISPQITISEQGEYRLLTKQDGLEGLFVAADYVLGDDETLFAPHKYKIKLFAYNVYSRSFILVNEYITKRKYGFNDAGIINVVTPELHNIKKTAHMGK